MHEDGGEEYDYYLHSCIIWAKLFLHLFSNLTHFTGLSLDNTKINPVGQGSWVQYTTGRVDTDYIKYKITNEHKLVRGSKYNTVFTYTDMSMVSH